jgi:Tol biopolymer transport system component
MKRVILLGALLVLCACGDESALPRVRALSPEGADHVGAGYSPDGARIYWWERDGERWQLWVSPADMSAPKQVPVLSRGTGMLVWSPNGSRFAVGAAVATSVPAVLVLDTSGGEPRRVTSGEVLGLPLAWHPDGKRLSYLTATGGAFVTMVVNVDGGPPARMVPDETRPHIAIWSPDGTRMAINVLDRGRSTIWLADSVGGNRREMTTEGFEGLNGPHPWSPDGTAVLYESRRTGARDVWLLPMDGSAPRQLTNDVRDDYSPRWSPDGRWIAFLSTRGLQSDVWVMPASGGPAQRVTDDAVPENLIGWRPETRKLAYTTGRTSRTLWTRALADGAERQLTSDSIEMSGFNVSSRGQVVATFDRGGGVFDFALLPLGGGEPRILLRDAGGSGATPWWSPDGSKLAFESDRGGSFDIWVMDAAGGAPRQLTNWPGGERRPQWSTDGSQIYFNSNHEATWGDVWRVSAAGGAPTRVTRSGRVLNLCFQKWRGSELFATVLGEGPNAFALARVRPDGSLLTLWDRTPAGCGAISPTTDSIAVTVGGEGGIQLTMLLPINGGPGRQLLEPGQTGAAWSPDGRQLVYSFRAGSATDLGIKTLADGSTRRITTTPASESGTEWSADGSTLVFQRSVPVNRIVTADLSRLLERQR